MSQLPITGPSLRVPDASIPLPTGPTIGAGIAEAGLRIAGALERVGEIQRRRRSAEIQNEDIDFLSSLHLESVQASMEGDIAEVKERFDSRVLARREEHQQIRDPRLRNAVVTRFGQSAARTGAALQSALVVREGERMQAAHEAFADRLLVGVEAGAVSVDEAVNILQQELAEGIGVYLSPEQVELQVGQARREFEQAAADGAQAELIELSTTLSDASADADTDEQRTEFRSAYEAALSEAVEDRAIDQKQAAQRLVVFDQVVKGKMLQEIVSLRERIQDAVALSDLGAVDRIATRAATFPPSWPQTKTLQSRINRAQKQITRSIDGAGKLLGAFATGTMPDDAPRDRASRNRAYTNMRAVGVPMRIAMDFFAQDGVLPTDLIRDARELFNPDGASFSIEEGMEVLGSVFQRDRDAARRLVAEDSMMKVALAGVHGDAQVREDVERLLGAGTAKRRLAEIDRLLAPKNAEDRKNRKNLVDLLGAQHPILDESQRDLYAGLVRLEFLRGRIELGETETDADDVADHAGERASQSFFRLRTPLALFQRNATIFYDPRLVGSNIRQFESAVRQFIFADETVGTLIFNRPQAPQTGMMVELSPTELLVPIFDDQGIRKMMVFDKTEPDARQAVTIVKRGAEGFEDLAQVVTQANRGASFDPLVHLKRQPGDPEFPDDSVVLEYLQSALGMLQGMELPEDRLRQQAELLADRLARDRGWSGLWGPEPE